MSLDSIVHHVIVDAVPEAAFDMFTARLGDWWPLAYTFSESRFADALVEPKGTWFERDDAGRTLPWGDVRAFVPGERVVLGFAIGFDRQPVPFDQASEVEVRFIPAGSRQTRVEVEHRHFARHGTGAATLRAGLDSPQGWPLILAELKRRIRRTVARTSAHAADRAVM